MTFIWILLASLSLGAAVYLAVAWIGPFWDGFSRNYVQDLTPRLRALGMEQSDIDNWMRWWGVGIFVTVIVFGVILQMYPVALGLVSLWIIGPRYLLDFQIKQRSLVIRDQLVRAAITLSNTTRAGHTLAQGFEVVIEDTPQPLGHELQKIVRDYRAGLPLKDAIRESRDRLDIEVFNIFSSAIVICLERGGRVTAALDQISNGLLELQRLERKLEADSASGRKMAFLLGCFPFAFMAMFTLLDPMAMGYLYTTLLGQIIILVIGIIVFLAARWCYRILDIDF